MKKFVTFKAALFIVSFIFMSGRQGVSAATSNTTTFLIDWNTTHQTLQGFGVYAGRAIPLFTNVRQRDRILNDLFSSNGLALTAVRAGILPIYSPSPGLYNFDVHANIAILPTDPAFTQLSWAQQEQLSQLWILRTLQKKTSASSAHAAEPVFDVQRYIASAWSPPDYMRKNSTKPTSPIQPAYYGKYADFLVAFVQAFQEINIPFTAISPANEPENITAAYTNTTWKPRQLVDFINNYLKPALSKAKLNTRVMGAENANWIFSSVYFIDPTSYNAIDIFARHGYSFPPDLHKEVTYERGTELSKLAWSAVPSHLPRWITEISSTKPFDPSAKLGLEFAHSLYEFLANDVSAFIFWLGVENETNNEALIKADGTDATYTNTKTYDFYGQFSRYIRPGFVRLDTQTKSLDHDVEVSAWRDTNQHRFAFVVINHSTFMKSITLQLKGLPTYLNEAYPIVTPKSLGQRWQTQPPVSIVGGTLKTTLSPESVVTFVESYRP